VALILRLGLAQWSSADAYQSQAQYAEAHDARDNGNHERTRMQISQKDRQGAKHPTSPFQATITSRVNSGGRTRPNGQGQRPKKRLVPIQASIYGPEGNHV
jgi:hypothetical protein